MKPRMWIGGALLGALMATAVPLPAQITPTKTWANRELLTSTDLNATFVALGERALDRYNGTALGTLTTRALVPSAGATYDLGTTGTRYKDGWWSGAVTAATATLSGALSAASGAFTGAVTAASATLTGTLAAATGTFSNTGAASIDTEGGITAGTGNVAIVDTTGKIPALSSTYLANLSGANLTALSEANITDGSLLARVAASETISSGWTFTAAPLVSNAVPIVNYTETDVAADNKKWRVVIDGGIYYLQALNDAESVVSTVYQVSRTGTALGALALAPSDTGVTIGGGASIKELLSSEVTWDAPSLTAGDPPAATSVGMTGITTNAVCFPSRPSGFPDGGVLQAGYLSAGNVQLIFTAASGTVNPGSLTYRINCFTH